MGYSCAIAILITYCIFVFWRYNNSFTSSYMRLRIIIILFFLFTLPVAVSAQRHALNMIDHDEKQYYFGITFGINMSEYRIQYSNAFAQTDTFKKVQPKWSPGFHVGLRGNLRLNKYFDLRFVPSLSFAEKRLEFNTPGGDSVQIRSLESVYMHMPLQLKFKSDRIYNFRFYALGGVKLDYDMASNARSRRGDEFLKVTPTDYGYEIGVGFEFFNYNFIFSPEIKLSEGLGNQLYRDKSLPLTNAIDQLRTRMIVISIHLEG